VVITVVPLGLRHPHPSTLLAAAVVVLLIVHRDAVTAVPDPAGGRWRAARVFTQFALAGIVINLVVLTFAGTRLVGYPGWAVRVEHAGAGRGERPDRVPHPGAGRPDRHDRVGVRADRRAASSAAAPSAPADWPKPSTSSNYEVAAR
jgi:hypothetical protein